MRKNMKKILLLFVILCFMIVSPASAYINLYDVHPETGYEEIICDTANLLQKASENKISAIWEQLEIIAQYGHAAVVTVDENSDDTSEYAQDLYREWFKNDSGVLFMIDMDNRQMYIFSDGAVNKELGRSMAMTITDNVYRYAADGDYYTCILEAFTQIATRLEGGRIAQPMRYLSAFFLAVLLSLLITYIMAKKFTSTAMGEEKEIFNSIIVNQELKNAKRLLVRSHVSVESSGGGDSGGGDSGGGGGGGSGSGGGHGF